MSKRALVTGGTGQDGWYLIDLLARLGYEIFAQSRQAASDDAHPKAQWFAGSLTDPTFLSRLLREVAPDEIYNLAAVSRPASSWDIPLETAHLNALVPHQICEFILREQPSCHLFQASSSEIFGDSPQTQNELTAARPKSPYGISKMYAHQIVGAYRERYGLHLSCGIMFNHESPRRPLTYVSQKIAHAAAAASQGIQNTRELDERGIPVLLDGKLALGDISVRRDFGFAGDFVEVMHLLLQQEGAGDYAIGTGESHSIAEFCEVAFGSVGLNWKEFVRTDASLIRKIDNHFTQADTTLLRERTEWKPKTDFRTLVRMMVTERVKLISRSYAKAP